MASSTDLLFSLDDLLFFFKTPDNPSTSDTPSRLFTQREIKSRISGIDFATEFEKIELYKPTIKGDKPLKISKLDYPENGLPEIDFIEENGERIGYNMIDEKQTTNIYFRSEHDKKNFSSILNRIYEDIEKKQSNREGDQYSQKIS